MFSVYYENTDKYFYVIGGLNSCDSSQALKSCCKFDVLRLKWEPMSSMNYARDRPGLFVSQNNNYLYAFGGEHDSFERYLFENDRWTILDVRLPK